MRLNYPFQVWFDLLELLKVILNRNDTNGRMISFYQIFASYFSNLSIPFRIIILFFCNLSFLSQYYFTVFSFFISLPCKSFCKIHFVNEELIIVRFISLKLGQYDRFDAWNHDEDYEEEFSWVYRVKYCFRKVLEILFSSYLFLISKFILSVFEI